MPRLADRPAHLDVSRRERQILDVLFARERATAAEIQANLPDAPSYSAVEAPRRASARYRPSRSPMNNSSASEVPPKSLMSRPRMPLSESVSIGSGCQFIMCVTV